MLPTFGGTELIILLVIILLLFGARRIPELARSLGRGAREFRKEISEAGGGDEAQDREEKGREESSPNGAAHDEPTRAEKVETTAASRSEAEV